MVLAAVLLMLGSAKRRGRYGRVTVEGLNYASLALSLAVTVVDCLKTAFTSDLH